ncbi:amidohydrolase family protein [Collimonas sp.]|jgi:predicted TIM-barrel fold metal-dependent hydrolase|uniref:amidohydrolase family protein n=1 Tax=Collimonas sp. TaxID=1963772 RepID=UPI002B54AEB7|nr:amidohydrolase family protein [Collimonas sp.]HWW07150.1 amidohydrolase family protein [Collimonas sp.]
MNSPARIDVHQHVIPPFWAEGLLERGGDPSGWKSPDWTPESAIAMMDDLGIATGVLSLTAPGVEAWQAQARPGMARDINDYLATLVSDNPQRFGGFAVLPLPDVDAALAEIAYSLDVLKADGVGVLSNYGDVYLGDPRFQPVWEELDRREAVVFVHPAKPAIAMLPGMPGPLMDYPYDTTRAAVQMVMTGYMAKFRKMKVILSHAGGFLPFISHRVGELVHGALDPSRSVECLLDDLQQFYFDTALSSGPAALPSLLAFAKPGHVLFGSDYPYAPQSVGASFTDKLDRYDAYKPGQLAAINNASAKLLFPRLA